MEFFRSLLSAVGLFVPSKVDIISELPLEVSHLILRKLDPSSLQSAALSRANGSTYVDPTSVYDGK